MMDKLKMHTPDLTDKNIEKIAGLFPNVITEAEDENGEIKKAVDFDLLRQVLSKDIVEYDDERYRLDWPGKKASILKANTPIKKTLRPCPEESVDFDSTENLYIEGDNFEVLKILQESYLGKVKMIYIDPPYNTGNDFIYKDDFKISRDDYEDEIGVYSEDGEKLFKNTDSNGRFHSDWLSMMYERLVIARDLLKDDGVVFISIDDNEVHNLRKICDEIFGDDNFVCSFIWRGGRRNAAKFISTSHEYMLCYSKNISYVLKNNVNWKEKKKGLVSIYKKAKELVLQTGYNYQEASILLQKWYKKLASDLPEKDNEHYRWIDKRGVYFASDISRGGGGGPKWNIKNPETGEIVKTPQRGWAYSKLEDLEADINDDFIHFNGVSVPCKKRYLSDNEFQLVETVFYKDRRGSSKRLRKLLEGNFFDFPKDEFIIKEKIASFTCLDDIVLDFFPGSSTTAHAVMQLNAEDGGNRKFIMVQLPEITDENSEAYKAGFKTISEIGKERIRRAGKKILEDYKDSISKREKPLDIGFRVFKTDSTNMKDIYYHPSEINQENLVFFETNIKEDRTPEDILTQVLLDLGLELSLPVETKNIMGNKVFIVQTNALAACFDDKIDFGIIDKIAEIKPFRVVFKDSSFKDDKDRINLEERFKRLSPDTRITVI
jgi:adenine-specific DNA-methyltransferase